MTTAPRTPGRSPAGWVLVGALAMVGLILAAVFGLVVLHGAASFIT